MQFSKTRLAIRQHTIVCEIFIELIVYRLFKHFGNYRNNRNGSIVIDVATDTFLKTGTTRS